MEEKKKTHKVIMVIACFICLALIIAIILPSFMPPKDSGPGYARIMCVSNMKQIAFSFIIYQDDNASWPDKKTWGDLIKPYVVNDEPFQCYIDKIGPCSYAMNENIPTDENDLPGDLVLLFESAPGWNQIGGPDDVVTNRHERDGKPGANIAFADGHVEFVEAGKISALRWMIEQ